MLALLQGRLQAGQGKDAALESQLLRALHWPGVNVRLEYSGELQESAGRKQELHEGPLSLLEDCEYLAFNSKLTKNPLDLHSFSLITCSVDILMSYKNN